MPLPTTISAIVAPGCTDDFRRTSGRTAPSASRRCDVPISGGEPTGSAAITRRLQRLDAAGARRQGCDGARDIPVIKDALETIGADPIEFNAAALRAFVLDRTKGGRRWKGKLIVSVMRVFLRYLIAQGQCRPGLDEAIPTLAMWRLSALPRYLPATDVDRIIDACNGTTPVRLRDRAIVLLLARLGLRAGDIVGMQLTDIDWRQASVRVAGKSRDEISLPLTQEVGEAVRDYLQRGRPPSTSTRLFVRMEAPWTPLKVSAVSALVRRSICRAKVDAPSHGAHVLRHSAATEMLRQGATLQQIGVVLRHRYLDTTALYAKVDVQRLREIALPWPEVAPC